MSVTSLEFEMKCFPLRGEEEKLVETPPGLNYNVHLNTLPVRGSNVAILKFIFRNRPVSCVTGGGFGGGGIAKSV
jgi:hypothetical protein